MHNHIRAIVLSIAAISIAIIAIAGVSGQLVPTPHREHSGPIG